MTQSKLPPDDFDAAAEAAQETYLELRDQVQRVVNDFADKNEIGQGELALLLVDIGITTFMLDYVFSVEKPSGSGLKLELDRFNREINNFVRSTKRTADEFVAGAKEVVAQAEAMVKSGGAG